MKIQNFVFVPFFPATLLALLASSLAGCSRDHSPAPAPALSLSASADEVTEKSPTDVELTAVFTGAPASHSWRQIAGPPVPLFDLGAGRARVRIAQLDVGVDTQLAFELVADFGACTLASTIDLVVRSTDCLPLLGENVQIGGATQAAAPYAPFGASTWVLRGVGGRLEAFPLAAPGPSHDGVHLPGLIRDIEIAWWNGRPFALVAMGSDGIALVDAHDPQALQLRALVRVGYEQTGLSWTDGGGTISTGQSISSTRGTIVDLESDGEALWIADLDYGVHRVELVSLLADTGPPLEADGTLAVANEICTLQFAGESPWGGPRALALHEGRLYVAEGELGLSIRDPLTLERLEGYNPYTDVEFTEDFFGAMDVADEAQPGGLDPLSGMPNCQQVAFEILEVMHGGLDAPTPWADFEGEGKYYYGTVGVAVADQGPRTIAYLACGVGGVIAVDVGGMGGNGASPRRLGFFPAVPARGGSGGTGGGEDARAGPLVEKQGLGRLQEGGTRSLLVAGEKLLVSDHFGGLIAVEGASDPGNAWRGENGPYDNDTDGIPGNRIPPYENVISYDCSPADPSSHESSPAWMHEHPSLLASGEVGGHGGRLLRLSALDLDEAGAPDFLQCVGAGGMAIFDLFHLSGPHGEGGFANLASLATTREIGAAPDGSASQPISIGHTDGIAASRRFLYLADGPHGVSAWRIADANGQLLDEPRLVANSVQSEGPVEVGGETILPATHAHGLAFDMQGQRLLASCRSVGLRIIGADEVESGAAHPGAPLLLKVDPRGVFEHKPGGEEEGAGAEAQAGPKKQDQAYDAVRKGDLAFVADGVNGLVIYDVTKDPTDPESGFLVGYCGGGGSSAQPLGPSSGVALWSDKVHEYALLAAGPRGIAVIDVCNPAAPVLRKVFEPIKLIDETEPGDDGDEDSHVGKADGRGVDVLVEGQLAYFSYDSFGVVCYALEDLVAPLPEGVSPTEIWKFEGGELLFDYRPVALGHLKLQEQPGFEDFAGGALQMAASRTGNTLTLLVAYADAGLAVIDWSVPEAPLLSRLLPTAGVATAVTVADGRIYVADDSGGVAIFR